MTWWGLLLGSQRADENLASIHRAVAAEAEAALRGGLLTLVAAQHISAEPYRMLQPFSLLSSLRRDLPPDATTVACVIAGLYGGELLAQELATMAALGPAAAGLALAAGYQRADFPSDQAFEARFADRRRALGRLAPALSPDRLWLCASSPAAAERATAGGAAWYSGPELGAVRLGELARSGGTGVIRRDVAVAADAAAAERLAAEQLGPKFRVLERWGYPVGERAAVVGEPVAVAERLRADVAISGAKGVVLRLVWPEMSPAAALDHIRLFTTSVLPLLQEAS